MNELKAPEQNRALGRIAEILRMAEQNRSAEFLPESLNVFGLFGDLFLPSAKTVEKMSYGDPLFRMAPSGTGSRIPMTTDKEYLADVAGMVPIAAPAAKPSARGAQELIRQIQTEPPVGAISPEIAAKVMPKTKVVDESGKPKLMYHGTAQDIKEFMTGTSNASFVTPDPSFAGTFAKYGEQRATKKLAENIDQNPEQKRAFLEPIIEEAMATGKLTSVNFSEHQKMAQAGFIKNLDMYTKDYWLKEFSNRPLYDITEIVGIGKEVTDALVSKLPVGRNVLPLYVDAKNPFDYEKPTHINKVISLLSKEDPTYYSGKRKTDLKRALQSGSWDDIENTDVQQAIKDLGFDSFYVKEQDVKNLGVFDTKKIKSALSDPSFEDVFTNPLLQDSTK
jgi:hypothetical protein